MNEELYIGFENYLNDEMTADEKNNFEENLQNDQQFRESFELYKQTTRFLATKFSSDTSDFKKNLDTISKEYFNEENLKSKVINLKPWYFAVAASVAILFGAWFFTQNSNPSYEDFDDHENAYFMERNDSDSNLKTAQDFFNKKDYKNAVASFEKIEIIQPEQMYFYAIALIETNNYSKAEILLKSIKQGNSAYKFKATWYLALLNLKQEKIQETKSYLKLIPDDADEYEKAQKLLKDLE